MAASGWRFAPPRGPGVSPQPIGAAAPEVRRLRVSALRGVRFGRVHSTTYI